MCRSSFVSFSTKGIYTSWDEIWSTAGWLHAAFLSRGEAPFYEKWNILMSLNSLSSIIILKCFAILLMCPHKLILELCLTGTECPTLRPHFVCKGGLELSSRWLLKQIPFTSKIILYVEGVWVESCVFLAFVFENKHLELNL